MILSTHIIIAAAASKPVLHNPVLVFLISIASHFIADMIPHWEYRLKSVYEKENRPLDASIIRDKKAISRDLVKVFIDGSLGVLVIFYLLSPEFSAKELLPFFLIIIGGVLPDSLSVLYWIFPRSPLVYVQRFHNYIHSNISLVDRPILGITSQIFINAVAIAFIML